MNAFTELEQPPVGGFCDNCGHFAYRHNETGCHTEDLIESGIRDEPCTCQVMRWQSNDWPRPWLPAPDGLVLDDLASRE